MLLQYNRSNCLFLLTSSPVILFSTQDRNFNDVHSLTSRWVNVHASQLNTSSALFLLTSRSVNSLKLHSKLVSDVKYSIPVRSVISSNSTSISVVFKISSGDNTSSPLPIFSLIQDLKCSSGKLVSLIATSPSAFTVSTGTEAIPAARAQPIDSIAIVKKIFFMFLPLQ